MNTEQQKTAAQQSQQNEAEPDGCDCLHCALGDAFTAWAARQGDALPAYNVGYHLGQFQAEVMSEVDQDCREEFKAGHLHAQLAHLAREEVGGGHVH